MDARSPHDGERSLILRISLHNLPQPLDLDLLPGNMASGSKATVGGGESNMASGSNATVGGGGSNTLAAIQGLYELVKELQAENEHMRAVMERAGLR